MIRGFCFATLVALLISSATNAVAQEVTLKFKFPDGRQATSEMQTKSAQTLTIAGMDLESGSNQTVTITTTNGKRAADGTQTVHSKIDAIKAEVTLPGGTELEFDSADADADPPGTAFDFVLDIFKATLKSTWATKMNKDNRVVAIEGRADAFGDLPQTLQDAMKAQLDPEYLKTAANDELDKVPTDSISKGDTWERTSTMRLDSGQKLAFTSEYTYAGTVQEAGRDLHKITLKTLDVDYSADADAPLKVVQSDLKVTDSDGHFLFDADKGQVVAAKGKVQIKGTLTLEIMGMELPGNLDLTMETALKAK